MSKNKDLIQLKEISLNLRKSIIETSYKAKIPHLGSCLSCLDILVYLYFRELNITPLTSNHQGRDRFVLSKGHGAPALFQVLAYSGYFPKSDLEQFGQNGSFFHEHPPKPGLINGIEAATGSLGHGMPMALGFSLASRISDLNYRVYALLSDGECNEGTIWESAMFASAQKISNLTIIIDYNKWQATGRSKEIFALEPFKQKWEAFGWHTEDINGHDFEELSNAFKNAKEEISRPSAIVAHTIKGKGISFMEDDNNWHYRTPNDAEFKAALKELNF